ncbi:unnamed protein product [Allacma fusca]|uniref:Uncharacterized protein n=1 Tax=Allacma fusca TaxID=39272 RepID=A0A8J2PV84_9HEXA|nr:unnamed protein product [Allacma fusca]
MYTPNCGTISPIPSLSDTKFGRKKLKGTGDHIPRKEKVYYTGPTQLKKFFPEGVFQNFFSFFNSSGKFLSSLLALGGPEDNIGPGTG